jgi:hypothetical protein
MILSLLFSGIESNQLKHVSSNHLKSFVSPTFVHLSDGQQSTDINKANNNFSCRSWLGITTKMLRVLNIYVVGYLIIKRGYNFISLIPFGDLVLRFLIQKFSCSCLLLYIYIYWITCNWEEFLNKIAISLLLVVWKLSSAFQLILPIFNLNIIYVMCEML